MSNVLLNAGCVLARLRAALRTQRAAHAASVNAVVGRRLRPRVRAFAAEVDEALRRAYGEEAVAIVREERELMRTAGVADAAIGDVDVDCPAADDEQGRSGGLSGGWALAAAGMGAGLGAAATAAAAAAIAVGGLPDAVLTHLCFALVSPEGGVTLT
eukprot:SAG22_NODE_2568_length_2433_cov_2.143959_3_plen_157_part_00